MNNNEDDDEDNTCHYDQMCHRDFCREKKADLEIYHHCRVYHWLICVCVWLCFTKPQH